MKVIAGIGDSIVDTTGRCTVTDTQQWLYNIMVALGETNINIEPLPGFSATPNILLNRWAAKPNLCDGSTSSFDQLLDGASYTINMTPYYSNGVWMFAVRFFTMDTAFTVNISTSVDGVTWTSRGSITQTAGHGAGWSYKAWVPPTSNRNQKYLKLDITGTMTVSEVQLMGNPMNLDRDTCLNKLVGENYTFHNVGLGSQYSNQVRDRFIQDIVDLDTDLVMILVGINDIYYNSPPLPETQANLMTIYDMADDAGITVVPITLLPYTPSSLTENRKAEIRGRIEALNSWIRTTAQIRRYGCCDWYSAMMDPVTLAMYPQYTCDGIHLSVLGNQKIVETFDLAQLAVTTHDFYATPVYSIPFAATRYESDRLIHFTIGNGEEILYRIYASDASGISLTNGSIVSSVSGTASGLVTTAEGLTDAYYRGYGVNTNVWTDEIFIAGLPIPPPEPMYGKSPEIVTITGFGDPGIYAEAYIKELPES